MLTGWEWILLLVIIVFVLGFVYGVLRSRK